jgi:hypothetical protein
VTATAGCCNAAQQQLQGAVSRLLAGAVSAAAFMQARLLQLRSLGGSSFAHQVGL